MTVVARGRQSLHTRLHALPLRIRLVAILLGLLAIALLLLSLTTAYLTQRDLLSGIDAELRSVAAPVAQAALDDLGNNGDTSTLPTGYAFALMLPDGTPVHVVNPTGEDLHPALPPITLTDERVRTGEPFTVRSTDGDLQWRFVAGRVDKAAGTFALGLPLRSVQSTVVRLLFTSGLISAAVLALCALIGWYAVTRAFRPLRQIEDTAAQIAKGDLTRRVPVSPADDEIASLGESLNVMLAHIEDSFEVREASRERMRQFVSDASHELRTPLATVRGYSELHRQGALPNDEATTAAFGRIEAEATRMAGLVEDLLTLARLDEEPQTVRTEVDLTVLAADAVADARARAPERVIRLTGVSDELSATLVWATEARIRQVVTNVVANALAHTPDGTPVEVRVGTVSSVTGDEAVLEVIDHGPGIPVEDRQKVFERFVRADKSRGRASGGGGTGLGLAIVAAIVQAHGGRVGLAETPGGGTTVVIHLPTGDSQAAPMER
jgi:two-component system OmpR family sensor kinase